MLCFAVLRVTVKTRESHGGGKYKRERWKETAMERREGKGEACGQGSQALSLQPSVGFGAHNLGYMAALVSQACYQCLL